MTPTDRWFARSQADLRQTGYTALIQSLGYADAVRFLVQLNPGMGDYPDWQDEMLGDVNVDEFYDRAVDHWERATK